MIKRNQLNLRNKINSFSLSFDTDEFKKNVEDNIHSHASSVLGKERRAWFKEPRPSIVNEIDQQLRKYFDIKEDNKLIFSMYYPPKMVDGKFLNKETIIKSNKESVFNRIIICTITEQVEMTLGKAIGEKLLMSPWVAYQSPPLVGGMIDYIFKNKNHMLLEAKKGFRSTRRSKKIEDRYILMFDYLVSQNDMDVLSNMLKKSP